MPNHRQHIISDKILTIAALIIIIIKKTWREKKIFRPTSIRKKQPLKRGYDQYFRKTLFNYGRFAPDAPLILQAWL